MCKVCKKPSVGTVCDACLYGGCGTVNIQPYSRGYAPVQVYPQGRRVSSNIPPSSRVEDLVDRTSK